MIAIVLQVIIYIALIVLTALGFAIAISICNIPLLIIENFFVNAYNSSARRNLILEENNALDDNTDGIFSKNSYPLINKNNNNKIKTDKINLDPNRDIINKNSLYDEFGNFSQKSIKKHL